MEHSPSWEANTCSVTQEILHFLWNLRVHYCVHKCLPLVYILSQMKLVHILTPYFSQIHFNIILPSMPSSSKWLLQVFPPTLCIHLLYLSCMLHDPAVITLIILGEEYKLWNSSLHSFLHPSVTSSLLGQNIFLSTLFTSVLKLHLSLNVRDKVSQAYKTTGKIILLYI